MKKLVLIGLVLSMGMMAGANAQESVFEATRHQSAVLPDGADMLSLLDSNLYCHATGLLLQAKRLENKVYCFVPDTLLAPLGEGVNYAVRHRQDGDIYFTACDRHGVSRLYVAIKKGGRYKVKHLKMSGMDVEHPVFSADGKIMVFASRERKDAYGCTDLWYSIYADGEWGKPENMGPRVNTRFDEISPSIYGEFLIFASNGREQGQKSLDLYATRLMGDVVSGDTAGTLMIGTNRVQRFPEPINNNKADDFEFVYDSINACGYWLSNKDGMGLYSFSGSPDGMMLWGRITDKNGKPVSGVNVELSQDGIHVCSVKSDNTGLYTVYLRRNQMYGISFTHDGCFSVAKNMNTVSFDRNNLFAEHRLDIEMDNLPLDEPIRYDDLFEVGTSTELSTYGRNKLASLSQFLHDNPGYTVSFSLVCDVSQDRKFNEMLTAYRLVTLKGYMDIELPESVKRSYTNACSDPNGTGLSRLTVVFRRGAK